MVLSIDESQTVYGQSMMCVHMSPRTLFEIAGLMTLNRPEVYYSSIKTPNGNITHLISKQNTNYNLDSAELSFSSGSFSFQYFSKNGDADLDFWEDVVSKHYDTGFLVETWGRPYLPSYCKPKYSHQVLNIRYIQIEDYIWKDTQDHSKWGVGMVRPLVCYGDINRMSSQESRGGGGICIHSLQLANSHKKIIQESDSCS